MGRVEWGLGSDKPPPAARRRLLRVRRGGAAYVHPPSTLISRSSHFPALAIRIAQAIVCPPQEQFAGTRWGAVALAASLIT